MGSADQGVHFQLPTTGSRWEILLQNGGYGLDKRQELGAMESRRLPAYWEAGNFNQRLSRYAIENDGYHYQQTFAGGTGVLEPLLSDRRRQGFRPRPT